MRASGANRATPRAAVTSWFAALRIARREARRSKGRSALVLAMIALPITALTLFAASYDTFELKPAEKYRQQYGSADAALTWHLDAPLEQDAAGEAWNGADEDAGREAVLRDKPATAEEITKVLPAGSRAIPYATGGITLRTATGIGDVEAVSLDIADPIARGLAQLREGGAPRDAREVALTEQAAARLHAKVGSTVSSPHRDGTWRVTGIVEFPGRLRALVVFPPGAMPVDESMVSDTTWLVSTPNPVTWDDVLRLNELGIVAASRAVAEDPPSPSETPIPYDDRSENPSGNELGAAVLIAGLGLLEVVLLAGPAFAVGARRRQRDLALVAANGGTPAHLRRIVLSDGVVLGLTGAALGIAAGIGIAYAVLPLAEEYLFAHRVGSFRVFPLALLGIAALALLTGVLAALVPAFTAARFNLVAALAGRRGAVRSRKRWWVLGLVVTGVGVGVVAYGASDVNETAILAGLILGELGLVLSTPALVGLISRAGGILPPAPRIALRDIGRNRASAAPAISAVMAAVAGSVAIGVYFTSVETRQEETYVAGLPDGAVAISVMGNEGGDPAAASRRMAEAARQSLPVRDIIPIQGYDCGGDAQDDAYCTMLLQLPSAQRCPVSQEAGELTAEQKRVARTDPRCREHEHATNPFSEAVGDPASLPALLRTSEAEVAKASQVLAAGGVVVSDRRFITDGTVTFAIRDSRTRGQEAPEEELPRITVPASAPDSGARHFTMILSPGAVAKAGFVVEPAGVLVTTTRMPTQADEDRLAEALLGVSRNTYSVIERGPESEQGPYLYLLAAAAALVTIGAAGIATGLAAADGRADLSTLGAVGASPRVRRLLSLSQSGLISGLGTLLGVVAGLGSAFAVLAAYNQAAADAWPVVPPYPLAVPWRSLLVIGVVPLVAMLGAGLLTRSRLPIERRIT